MAIIGKTFNETFENYKVHYIRNHGLNKYEKAYSEVINNSKFKQALQWSRNNHNYLGGADYSNLINSIFYFMFKNNETTAMGILIAINYWNDYLNSYLNLCSDFKVNEIAESTLRQYCLALVIRS